LFDGGKDAEAIQKFSGLLSTSLLNRFAIIDQRNSPSTKKEFITSGLRQGKGIRLLMQTFMGFGGHRFYDSFPFCKVILKRDSSLI